MNARLALPFALALALTATGAHAQEPEVVTLWHAYGEAETRGLDAAITAYEAAHPGVRVDAVRVPFGAYASRLETAIPAGTGPDVFLDAHERLSSYLLLGIVERVDETPLELDVDPRYLEVLRAAAPHGPSREPSPSHQFGIPVALKTLALFVNADLLPAVEGPRTLASIESTRATLPEQAYPLALHAEDFYFAAAFVHGHGGRSLDDDGQFALESPETVAAFEQLRDMSAREVIPEEPDGALVSRLFTSGNAAAAINGPWMLAELPEGLNFRVEPLPTIDTPEGPRPLRAFLTVEAAFLASGGPNPSRGLELARFLGSREGSLPRLREGRQIIVDRAARAELARDPVLAAFAEAADVAVPMPTNPNMRVVFEPMKRALQSVLRSGVAPDVALATAARRFRNQIRPLPSERPATLWLIALGLLLLGVAGYTVQQARKPGIRKAFRESIPAYRYVIHAAVILAVLVFFPVFVGLGTSLFSGHGVDMYFVGTANFELLLSNRGEGLFAPGSFFFVLGVTILWTLSNVAMHVGIGLALALLLQRPYLRLRAVYRVLLILPWAVPSYITALTWKGMFHRQYGAINALLELLGAEPTSFFGTWPLAFAANVATNVWLGFPFMMVVVLGGLAAIPRDLYEAASLDGATAWQRFKLITWPLLRPSITPAVAMGAIWTFNMFNVVYLVSGGAPDGATEILISDAYRWAFTRSSQYGYAAAYAVLIMLILFVSTRPFGKLDGMGGTK